MDLEALKKNVVSVPDDRLRQYISEGKDAYVEGVYQIYVTEAERRAISISDESIEETKADYRDNQGQNLVKLGYALGFLGGIGGYIVAIVIWVRKIQPEGKYSYYPKETKRHVPLIIAFTTIMVFIGWRLIGNVIRLVMH